MGDSWILTGAGPVILGSGGKFKPLDGCDPLEDIASALSGIRRSAGRRDWSVAQHSLMCCNIVSIANMGAEMELACLLHDVEEAYTGDMTSPWLRSLPDDVRQAVDAERQALRNSIIRYLVPDSAERIIELVDSTAMRATDALALAAEVEVTDNWIRDLSIELGFEGLVGIDRLSDIDPVVFSAVFSRYSKSKLDITDIFVNECRRLIASISKESVYD